jgi:hypothetical protein
MDQEHGSDTRANSATGTMYFLISSIYQTEDMKEPQCSELENMFISVHVMCVEWVHVLLACCAHEALSMF